MLKKVVNGVYIVDICEDDCVQCVEFVLCDIIDNKYYLIGN